MNLKNVDLVVIGSGPAGLAAAIKAKENGVQDVLIIERAEQLGGLLHQCVHNGFGLFYFNEDLTGPEYAHRFVEKTRDVGVNLLLETMVLRLTADRKITFCNSRGLQTLQAKAVVLAMGCRERTREAILIPGYRPAGIFTAGTAQRIINVEGYLPGKEIVILGSGDIGMIMARRLILKGANVKAVVEILPYIGGLIRNEVQCLHDFDVNVFLRHTITDVHGMERIEGVTIAEVDKGLNPISRTERRIDCDTLLVSVGLIPENELTIGAGGELDPITGGPILNEMMETSIPGIFAAGNVVHVNDLVDNVTLEGELAGENAAKYIIGALSSHERVRLIPGENVRYIVPQSIGTQEGVTISFRVREPAERVRFKIGNIMTSKAFIAVKPSEMIKIDISLDQLKELKKGTTEIIVDQAKQGRERR